MIFTDFKQTYDSVGRHKLFQDMEHIDIPFKLMTLTKMKQQANIVTQDGNTPILNID